MDESFDEAFEEDFSESELAAGEFVDQRYRECLKKRFGFSNFRPFQWKIISSVMERKRDVLAVMATGYGKSLCFQFPSVFLNTITLVVSPLISLMEDQVMSLTLSNIKACFLGSAQKDRSTYQSALSGEYRIVYLTPELLTSDFGETLLHSIQDKLTMIAIDEAHCISKWGHDFRSAFRHLGLIRRKVPGVPILALTATATPQVREDIIASLGMSKAEVVCTGFDRTNLQFFVSMKSKEGVWHDVGNLVRSSRLGSTIIYCLTRKQTEEVAALLKMRDVECEAYHAGLSLSKRKEVHEDFVRDRVRVIVATIAFGMGIDKPDVRLVIHYGASKDLESYYQEIGRAGRDGLASKCHMFYSHGDFQIHSGLRTLTNAAVNTNLENLSLKMREYINTTDCRRWFILQYFEGVREKPAPTIRCCDNCLRNLKAANSGLKYEGLDENGCFDFSKDAEMFLKSIRVFGGNTGLQLPLFFLRGSKNQRINRKLYEHDLYGSGRNKSEDWWKGLAHLLEEQGFLRRQNMQRAAQHFRVQTIGLSRKAEDWLEAGIGKPLSMKLPKDMYPLLKVKCQENLQERPAILKPITKMAPSSGKDERVDLVKELMLVRLSLASEFDVMPYMICSNRAIFQMASKKPATVKNLQEAQLDGFSDVKVEKFGSRFVQCIQNAVGGLAEEQKSNGNNAVIDFLRDHPLEGVEVTPTVLRTLELWKDGKNINQISQLRGIVESTASTHIARLVKAGYMTKLDLIKLGVKRETFEQIECQLQLESDIMTIKLKDLKEKLPENITWDQLKFVVNYCQLEKHVKINGGDLSQLQAINSYPEKEEFRETSCPLNTLTSEASENSTLNSEGPTQSLAAKYLDDESDLDFSSIEIPNTNAPGVQNISNSNSPYSQSNDFQQRVITEKQKISKEFSNSEENNVSKESAEFIVDDSVDELNELILAASKLQKLGDCIESQVEKEQYKDERQSKKRILKRKNVSQKIEFLESSSEEDEPTRSKFFPKRTSASTSQITMKTFKPVEF